VERANHRAFAEREGLDKLHPDLMTMLAAWKSRRPPVRTLVERDAEGVPLTPSQGCCRTGQSMGVRSRRQGWRTNQCTRWAWFTSFGLLGHRMDYVVTRIQSEFPDCEAFREVAPGRWQRVRIEFEFESRNFLLHKHDPKKCDVIVCWKHNWAECPANIEVIELSSIMKRLM
jgi:hypothetical protein